MVQGDNTMPKEDRSPRTTRRKWLAGIGALGSAGLAGCFGDDTEGNRVETIVIEYWSDLFAATFEDSIPTILDNLEELGLDVEARPVAVTSQAAGVYNDDRTHHFSFFGQGLAPERLDPFEWCWRMNLFWAGDNGLGNLANYADCEHTRNAYLQSVAETEEERRQYVNKTLSIESDAITTIPLFSNTEWGAYNNEEITPGGIGDAGLLDVNSNFYFKSSSETGELVVNTTTSTVESNIPPALTFTSSISIWNNLFYSPLVGYDENFELINVLASDYQVESGGTEFIFQLDDATFHDGSPITAEDVQFTYNFLNDNVAEYPELSSVPIENIEILSESEVKIDTEEPFLSLLTQYLPRWGVLPKDHWTDSGAQEDPTGFELDPIIGSGPFEVTTFSQNQLIVGTPHDGHPRFSPDSDIILDAYDDISTAVRDFEQGDLNILVGLPAGSAQRIRDEVGDTSTVEVTDGFLPFYLSPQMSFGPQMFREFRMAVSQAIDRDRINDSALYGEGQPLVYSTKLTPQHPWRPPEDQLTRVAETTSSNIETARQVLEDAGWDWDDDGRLLYPDDIDLEPLWPEGDEPRNYPDIWECVPELENHFT